ncbi:MAG: hypothetical protein QW507_01040 [Candidatus Nanoarchaeia archaeon]|nr:hypothetical protein [Candidatus Haiyanarchaeum thermophilum]MCW1303400.1 hypothetical protein [Candidatus Haiyanarchaeum thermophilum]MCW1303913.1 hypothetical protein [Candidatus Haiyanarchaeum thermophilum]MCW1306762.1 hypothetical protein [Candidatus Haiyanarchaeum thermophilum]MCW1307426.1 hypothetical protein [Candidatus Haiyanarchaeum thermophilum]
MDVNDLLTMIFLVTFVASVIEFLVLGIWKIYEFLSGDFTIFIMSLIAPVIAVISFAVLLLKR